MFTRHRQENTKLTFFICFKAFSASIFVYVVLPAGCYTDKLDESVRSHLNTRERLRLDYAWCTLMVTWSVIWGDLLEFPGAPQS